MFQSKYDMGTNTYKPVKVAGKKGPAKKPAPAAAGAAPDPNAPVGQGGRFAALKDKLSSEPGVNDPGAVAASIGRKKYGAKKFNSLSK